MQVYWLKANWLHANGNETILGLDLEHSKADTFEFQPLTVTVTSWGGGSTTYTKGFVYRDQEITYQNVSPYLQHNMMLSGALGIQLGARL